MITGIITAVVRVLTGPLVTLGDKYLDNQKDRERLRHGTDRVAYQTDAALRRISPPAKRTFYTDTRQAGLRLMVTPAGTKTFQCRAWSAEHGKPITKTLGKYPALTITNARKLAGRVRARFARPASRTR